MHYIIDGYNLFFTLQDRVLPLSKQREKFIRFLSEELAEYRIKATLVFDSGTTHREVFPSRKTIRGIDIIFSPEGVSADHFIIEMVEKSSSSSTQVVVTSDRTLARHSTYLGAQTQTIDTFLELLSKKQKKAKSKFHEKQESDCDAQISRLEQIFEERLKNETSD